MAELPNYHIREQLAYALLGPMRATLLELERRARTYVNRLAMQPAERDAVEAAQRALATARAEIDKIWRGSDRPQS
jgi:hypothetical protein